MVVPGSEGYVQQVDNNGTESAVDKPRTTYEVESDEHGTELEEVHRLPELVWRLEVQNQALCNHDARAFFGEANSNITAAENVGKTGLAEGVTNTVVRLDHNVDLPASDLEPSPSSSSSEDESHLQYIMKNGQEEGTDGHLPLAVQSGHCLNLKCSKDSKNLCSSKQGSIPQDSLRSDTHSTEVEQSALDTVEVLDLEECNKMENEDSWLYVSPKKRAAAEQGPESSLKWCRQVLDHPSPEMEAACRMLLNRLDQANRWRNVYNGSSQSSHRTASEGSLPATGCQKSLSKEILTCGSSGYLGALSSQSSVDSEVSTSDDSVSLGYKLQDLTDVQIMARLQEESEYKVIYYPVTFEQCDKGLRQDYISSSASVSRRSSAASLQSPHHGTYSDQEFDACSLEEEEEKDDSNCHSLPCRLYAYSPSKGDSPHRQSPGSMAEYRRFGVHASRIARRSVPGPSLELQKIAKREEKLRCSMPDLAPRTSLRTLEALRNSRSMEANMQGPASHMSCLPTSAIGMTTARLHGTQSLLSFHTPLARSMAGVLQPQRRPSSSLGTPSASVRRVQPPGTCHNRAFSGDRATSAEGKSTLGHLHSSLVEVTPSHRGRLIHPSRRSLGLTKPCSTFAEESWREGCY